MKINFIKSFLACAITSLILIGCINSDVYSDPNTPIQTYNLVTNKTVASLVVTSTATKYTDNHIIEGYVTSSDENGTFFNTITFQSGLATEPNLKGFSVSVELKAFVNGFKPGRKVYIKLKDLYLAKVDGSIKIGSLFEGEVGRISQFDWKNHLFPSETIVDESLLVKPFTIGTDNVLNDAVLNTLIEFDNVQFTDGSLNRTLFDIDTGGLATNHNIVSANGGTNRYLRMSSFSILAGEKIPTGRGKIRCIMTKFGSDYQVFIRYLSDLKLNNPRTYNFRSSFTENFNGFNIPIPVPPAQWPAYNSETSYLSFKEYPNFATVGTKNWYINENSFLVMSAFNGEVEKSKCYFLVPVNMTDASSFKFDFKFGFYSTAGTAFKIYRTTDFVPGMNIANATLFDISTSFNLPPTSTPNFTTSGIYNIPANVTGNGYFVFEYSGTNITANPAVTTTVQIDNIVVN